LNSKQVEESLREVLGEENTAELLKISLMNGTNAVGKVETERFSQATRATKSSKRLYQSAPSQTSEENDSSGSVVDLEALSSVGPSIGLAFDAVLVERLLYKEIIELMPKSQAGNGPNATCTIGATVYLTAVLECVIHLKVYSICHLNLLCTF
jgi:hypothetical protein